MKAPGYIAIGVVAAVTAIVFSNNAETAGAVHNATQMHAYLAVAYSCILVAAVAAGGAIGALLNSHPR